MRVSRELSDLLGSSIGKPFNLTILTALLASSAQAQTADLSTAPRQAAAATRPADLSFPMGPIVAGKFVPVR